MAKQLDDGIGNTLVSVRETGSFPASAHEASVVRVLALYASDLTELIPAGNFTTTKLLFERIVHLPDAAANGFIVLHVDSERICHLRLY